MGTLPVSQWLGFTKQALCLFGFIPEFRMVSFIIAIGAKALLDILSLPTGFVLIPKTKDCSRHKLPRFFLGVVTFTSYKKRSFVT